MNPLVAHTIHDVKNTLTVLSTWLTEAEKKAPSTALSKARVTADQLGVQLVELLAIYRADENSLRLTIADHDLTDFCNDVRSELIVSADDARRIATDTSAAMAIGVWAFDAYQVKLTLQDALRNALRHSQGGIQFGVSSEPGGGIRFMVRDIGPGFPLEILNGAPSAMHKSGSGLGQTFARLIAERHRNPEGRQGSLRLFNDGGAVFMLVLP